MTIRIFEDAEDSFYKTKINRLCESIETVVIVKGHVPNDPVIWEIHLLGGVLRIDSKKIEIQDVFRKAYITEFYHPAPSFKQMDWYKFVECISQMAVVIKSTEESEAVYISNQVFDKIRELPITDDQTVGVTGRALLKHEEFYCLTSSKVSEIVEVYRFRIAPNVLSSTMTALGYKTAGTPAFRCDGKLCRFWWFYPDIISKYYEPLEETNLEIAEEGM
jgi:hypothetical protein